jgi:hypothetical protein
MFQERRITADRVAGPLIVSQLLLLLATAPWYSTFDLQIAWRTLWPMAAGQVMLVMAWLYFRRYSDHPTKYLLAQVILITALLALLTNIVSPAQYLAVRLNRPLIDAALARADTLLGINTPTLVHWTAGHPTIALLLKACYFSLLPQFFLPIVLLGMRYRDREQLWEYAFHFHFCLIVTLAALALFPAACAFQYFGIESTIDQTRFIAQFSALRNGTFRLVQFNDLEGLISVPSFHVAGALMVTWAFRRYRPVFGVLLTLNAGLIAATVLSGAHYFVDLLASLLLFAVSVLLYRGWFGRVPRLHYPEALSPCSVLGESAAATAFIASRDGAR